MKFMIFIRPNNNFQAPATLEPETIKWVEDMTAKNIRLTGNRLLPASDAKFVTMADGELVVKAAPLDNEDNQIGGFDILEAPSLEAAIDAAAQHPMASHGLIEIRPFWEEAS